MSVHTIRRGRRYVSEANEPCREITCKVAFTEKEWEWVKSLARRRNCSTDEVVQCVINAGIFNDEYWDEEERVYPFVNEE